LEWLYNQLREALAEVRFRAYYGPVFHRFLHHTYPYYRQLSPKDKMPFLRLVRDHYEFFEFVPRKIKLSRAMKAIIYSAAAQLVLRLPPESLTFWRRIIIYPADYESKITGRWHQGEVNPRLRTIVLGWKGVMKGLHRTDDGINLLLHEFAHALWLEHKLAGEHYTVLNPFGVAEFERLAFAEMQQLNGNETHFFRRYAFSNMEEFFAVAVENFFERPVQLRAALPSIYEVLQYTLRQDPAARSVA
jgi:Mlc titration factor MtfA (ptsG expression regulator)